MRLTACVSAIAANRKKFFDLVSAIEREGSCSIDVRQLEQEIDGHYDGRERLTAEEVRAILSKCARYIKPRSRRA